MQIMFTLRFIQLGFCFEIDVSSSNCCFQFFVSNFKYIYKLFYFNYTSTKVVKRIVLYSYSLQLQIQLQLQLQLQVTVTRQVQFKLYAMYNSLFETKTHNNWNTQLQLLYDTIRYTYNRFQVHSLQTFRKQRSVYELN